MSDEVVTTDVDETPDEVVEPKPDDKPTFKAIESQDALDKIIKDRLARNDKKYADHDKYKAAFEQLQSLEAAKQAEEREKLTLEERLAAERADFESREKSLQASFEAEKQALQSELDSLKMSQLRAEVAAAKQVPASLMGRLQGATKEELEADADALLAAVAPSRGPSPRRPDPVGGGAPHTDVTTARADKDMVDRLLGDILL